MAKRYTIEFDGFCEEIFSKEAKKLLTPYIKHYIEENNLLEKMNEIIGNSFDGVFGVEYETTNEEGDFIVLYVIDDSLDNYEFLFPTPIKLYPYIGDFENDDNVRLATKEERLEEAERFLEEAQGYNSQFELDEIFQYKNTLI